MLSCRVYGSEMFSYFIGLMNCLLRILFVFLMALSVIILRSFCNSLQLYDSFCKMYIKLTQIIIENIRLEGSSEGHLVQPLMTTVKMWWPGLPLDCMRLKKTYSKRGGWCRSLVLIAYVMGMEFTISLLFLPMLQSRSPVCYTGWWSSQHPFLFWLEDSV